MSPPIARGAPGGLDADLDIGGQRLVADPDHVVGTHRARDVQGGGGEVGRVDGAGAACFGGGDGEHPDRPAPVDERGASAHVTGPIDGVQPDGEGFGDRALLRGHALGQEAQLVGPHDAQGGESAGLVRLERRRAEVAHLGPQIRAVGGVVGHGVVADEGRRVDRDALSHLDAADVGADLRDVPADLVAEHERIAQHGGAGDGVAPVGDVGAADPAPLHRDEHVARPARRVGQVVDSQVVGTVDYHCFHVRSSHVKSGRQAG